MVARIPFLKFRKCIFATRILATRGKKLKVARIPFLKFKKCIFATIIFATRGQKQRYI